MDDGAGIPAADSPEKPGDEPRRRISVVVGEHQIEVEGPDDMDTLVAVAERMWSITRSSPDRMGFRSGSTLYTELSGSVIDQGD